MKKFKCKNGEIVEVEDFNKNDPYIFVHYKGKVYREPKIKIGKTLFETKELTVQIGNIVKIENCQNNEIFVFKICGAHTEKLYKRMGGSYYGNSVNVAIVGDNIGFEDGIFNVSTVSPFGKSLLNKSCGEEITVSLPDRKTEKYKIVSIK